MMSADGRQMKALVLDGPGSLALRDLPQPAPDDSCLVRVRMAGICGTDLQLLDGYAGFRGTPGHEFVGVVEDVAASGDRHWIGQRVVGEINVGCGRCRWCEAGVKEHCLNRTVVGIRGHDGAFAEYLTLPASNLHRVPDDLDDEAAVFVEPVAAACRILEQIAIDDRTRVAVLGDGRLGLLTAQVLRTAAREVIVFGRHEHKRAIARSLGLAAEPATGPLPAVAFDVVVDATGRPEGFRGALELVRPRGTIVMKSTFHGEAPIAAWPIVVNEVTIVGSRCGPFPRAIAVLASGAVRTGPLVSRVARLEEYASAFADARRSMKVLFRLSL
jgi:alcohol dehydrogenase